MNEKNYKKKQNCGAMMMSQGELNEMEVETISNRLIR